MIGLMPAAGYATRLQGLPKQLLPVGETTLLGRMTAQMVDGGANRVYAIANSRNWGILSTCAPDGLDVHMHNSRTMAETVLEGRKLAGSEPVLFGMPDTYVQEPGVFGIIAEMVQEADLVVGMFETRPEQRSSLGMVAPWGVRPRVIDKPTDPGPLQYAWGILAWNAPFWDFIKKEMNHVGDAINPWEAVHPDRTVFVLLPGLYWDCGTFEEYAHLIGSVYSPFEVVMGVG